MCNIIKNDLTFVKSKHNKHVIPKNYEFMESMNIQRENMYDTYTSIKRKFT